MKKKIIVSLLSVPCFLVAQNGFALEASFIPRANIGYSYYSIEWSEAQVPETGITVADLNVNLLTGSVGGTVTLNKFYIDTYVQQSMDGSDDYHIEGWRQPIDWDVNIFDFSVALGYNVWKGLAVYGGWKRHETAMDGYGSSSDWPNWDYEFDTEGWFTGVSYGVPIGEANLLSFNVAYAWLEGDFQGTQLSTNGMSSRAFQADDGDSGGVTIGAAWKGYLTDLLSYSVTVDWYAYSYEDFQHNYSKNGEAFYQTNWTNTVDEEAMSCRFTISYDL